MINVTGNVYFAITPKCVMGGGALHLGLDVGPVSAWLDVALDVFIQFKPFHYTADLMVSVGCAISIDVWFVHIRVSASVGAALHIEGPDPFGGVSCPHPYSTICDILTRHRARMSISTCSRSLSTSATDPHHLRQQRFQTFTRWSISLDQTHLPLQRLILLIL
jgi:hypothetical protein